MEREQTHSWTWAEVWQRRLGRHRLLEPAPISALVDVVSDVCGIHAQVMAAAELSLGSRVAGIIRSDVRAALWDERSLVKTYGIRGTIHLLASAELPFLMAALRCRRAGELTRLARVGLDATRLASISDAIGEALDGQRLTLKQLEPEVVRRCGAWSGEKSAPAFAGAWPRWRMALGWAATEGALCFGPNEGAEVTFVRPDQWLGAVWDADAWRSPDAERQALTVVYRRYLHAYGPATARTFAQWFNIPNPLAREIELALREELVEVDVEGYRAFILAPSTLLSDEPGSPTVRLLPHFDCYLRGAFPREPLVGEWKARAADGTGNVPILLVDGVVGGIWQRRERRGRAEITVEPFVELSPAHRDSLEAAATRIGEFLELPIDLTLGSVAVRPHL